MLFYVFLLFHLSASSTSEELAASEHKLKFISNVFGTNYTNELFRTFKENRTLIIKSPTTAVIYEKISYYWENPFEYSFLPWCCSYQISSTDWPLNQVVFKNGTRASHLFFQCNKTQNCNQLQCVIPRLSDKPGESDAEYVMKIFLIAFFFTVVTAFCLSIKCCTIEGKPVRGCQVLFIFIAAFYLLIRFIYNFFRTGKCYCFDPDDCKPPRVARVEPIPPPYSRTIRTQPIQTQPTPTVNVIPPVFYASSPPPPYELNSSALP